MMQMQLQQQQDILFCKQVPIDILKGLQTQPSQTNGPVTGQANESSSSTGLEKKTSNITVSMALCLSSNTPGPREKVELKFFLPLLSYLCAHEILCH
jgi:hypothetical protein